MERSRPAAATGADKFRRYREAKRRRGLREVRIWLPDVGAPGFAEEAARQAALLGDTAGEREAVELIDDLLSELSVGD